MIILPPQAIGRGYRQLQLEEPIHTTDEWFSIVHETQRLNPWRPSSYWTSQSIKHTGRVPYRRAVSARARLSVHWRLIGKVWRWAWEPVTKVNTFLETSETKTRWHWWFPFNLFT